MQKLTWKKPTSLLLYSLLFLCPPPSSVFAQNTKQDEELPPRKVESLIISDKRPPEFFFQDMDGEFKPFRIGFQRTGGTNLVPPSSPLILYKKIDPPEVEPGMEPEQPTYNPVMSLELLSGDDPLLLVFYQDKTRKMQYRFLEAGPEAFGALEIQLINLSDSLKVIAMLDDKSIELKPKSEMRTAGKVSQDKRFSFRYGSVQPSGDLYVSPETRLRIPFENMRLRIFFAPVERTVQTKDGPKTEMVLRDARVFERVQP